MRLLRFLPLLLVSLCLSAADKPNILFIAIDDQNDWIGCLNGNPEVKTPHIDRLAREGIAFEQFYVNSPICSPSRVAISTGQYPQRWRITSYLAHRRANKRRGMAQWLAPKAPMLARSLKQAGLGRRIAVGTGRRHAVSRRSGGPFCRHSARA